MFGYIYITTNLINNKKYIGKHIAAEFDSNYKGSGTDLKLAIKEFGWDNFECHILEPYNNIATRCNSLEELNLSEKYYIELFNCVLDENFYNLKPGGDGFSSGPVAESTKEKIKNWNLNKILIHKDNDCIKIDRNELDNYKLLGWLPGPLPFARSAAFKEKVAATITGQIGMHKGDIKTKVNPEQVDDYLNLGYEFGWVSFADKKCYQQKTIAGVGKKRYMHKDDVYKLVYESNWNDFLADGWIFGNKPHPNVKRKTGYHLSEEHIQKLKISHLGHKNTPEAVKKQADKLRGRICVYNKDNKVKYIYSNELENYLSQGWIKGRPCGAKKNSKIVICYETNEEFSYLTEVYKKYPKATALKNCLKASYNATCVGYHWYFKTDLERKKWLETHIEVPAEAIIKTIETGCDLEF